MVDLTYNPAGSQFEASCLNSEILARKQTKNNKENNHAFILISFAGFTDHGCMPCAEGLNMIQLNPGSYLKVLAVVRTSQGKRLWLLGIR